MRVFLVVLFATASFAPFLWRARKGRRAGLAVLLPPLLFAGLCMMAFVAETRWIHSLKHSSHAMWLLWWFVMGFGLAFPPLYASWLVIERRKRGKQGWELSLITATNTVVGALIFYSLFIEPATLAERHYEIVTPRAPETPLTILHVSDLQTDGECRRERLAREAASSKTPDLVIFTGDIINDAGTQSERTARVQAAQRFFAALKGRHGEFGVPGDWDGWVEDWPALLGLYLENSSMQWLDNDLVRLQINDTPVLVYGVGGVPMFSSKAPIPTSLASEEGLRIVAVHHPDDAIDLVKPGAADLILVGHTHGGQVVVPGVGAIITHTEAGWAGGQHEHEGIPMLISRGIGMRGAGAPRLRFGCAPEISWITIRRP